MNAKIVRSTDMGRQNRVPPGQKLVAKFPVLHYGSVYDISPKDWKLKIFGLTDNEVEITFDDLQKMDKIRVLSDIHCVTRWTRLDNVWDGVSTSALRQMVKIKPETSFVIIHAAGNFTTNLPVSEFFQEDVLLATHHDEKPLSAEHGGPVRLVVPRLYFWKSAKWINGIEFTSQDRPGFWESNGYHNHGDPWLEERYG